MMNQRQKQKSLLIDPSNKLHFNVAHQSIHMKKIKPTQGNISSLNNILPSSPLSSVNKKLYYSVVEKESQTGISFNQRLFFLKDDDSFGYVSKASLDFQVQSAKETVPLKSLRKVVPKGKILTLQFQVRPTNVKQSDKIIEKKWILRMKDKKMADAWTDIINYQISQIPSRKSTIEKQNVEETQNNFESNEIKLKKQEKRVKFEEPIANQRPEQDYISIQKYDSESQFSPQSQTIQKYNEGESPIKQQRSQNEDIDDIALSPGSLSLETDKKSQKNYENSINDSKIRNYILEGPTTYQREFYEERTFYEQIEQDFQIRNKQLKQKLYLPSFINYFRPYIDKCANFKNSLLEIDKKYEDFITFCEITSKQLIDIEEVPLYQFRLSNRFIAQRQTQFKDKMIKEMSQMYEKVFKKSSLKSMDIQSLLLLFENILYAELEDVEIIVPLMELKNLPMPSDTLNGNSNSSNKVCQTSLVREFENMQKNLTYIYKKILSDEILREYFLIPMSCQIQYKGFTLFFRSKVSQNLSKLTVFDSTKEAESLAVEKTLREKILQQQKVQNMYKKLGEALYVNPDLFQHETHTKFISFKTKLNQSAAEQVKIKNVIIYADILPYLSSNQILNDRIFSQVHKPDFLLNKPKQIRDQNKSVSENSSRFQVTSRFNISNSETKTLSKLNKTSLTRIPFYNHFVTAKQNELQIRHYREQINQFINSVAQKFEKFDTSVIHPVEIYEILQQYYLDHQHLGKIIQKISTKNSFAKSILKSQIAAECTKLILFKKAQQLILSENAQQQEQNVNKQENMTKTLTTLLNLILGKYEIKQTEMVWKVLTLHAQIIYELSISQKEIHKGYFILALVSKLNININPSSASIDDIFKNDKFIIALKFQTCRPKPVQILSSLLKAINDQNFKQVEQKDKQEIEALIEHLVLNENSIPYFVKRSKLLYGKILSVLTKKISPTNLKFSHLNLYDAKSLNFTQIQGFFNLIDDKKSNKTASGLIKEKQLSLKRQSWEENFTLYIKRKLKQIQHKITQKITFNFVKEVQAYIKEIKIFYQNHPFISELLEFLSDYYVSKYDCHNGLQCLKVSLANMIAICEGNTNHCRLTKIYIKMGSMYEKMRKYEESLNQYKRSKHCLQVNKQDNTQLYALTLIKMAKVTLQIDGNISEAVNYAMQASKKIQSMEKLQKQNILLLIEAFEIQAKCLRSQNLDNIRVPQSFNIESRPQHYLDALERALIKENNGQNKNKKDRTVNLQIFQRFLRIILPYYFSQLSQKAAEMMMNYMCELTQNISKKGGVICERLKNDEQSTDKNQGSLFYPAIKGKGNDQSQNLQTSKVIYNVYEAQNFIKQQILKGSFVIELIEYIDKAADILTHIKKQIKLNLLSKTQSRSSRMNLMSTNGPNQSETDIIFSNLDHKARQPQRQNLILDDSDPYGLEKLLDFSKEGRSITQKDAGYSNRQKKFDSLIRALIVLLGDGFMLHIFEE